MPEAWFMAVGISNFYLITPLKRQEFIHINLKDIIEERIKEYKLEDIARAN
jgi:hypothetical protein